MFGVFLEQVEKCKAVHLRHEQIEKDYARRCLIDALEPCSTIRCPVDRASLALKQLSDEINDVRDRQRSRGCADNPEQLWPKSRSIPPDPTVSQRNRGR